MTEKELHEQANEILHTFEGKQYNDKELMVVVGYVLIRLVTPMVEQNSATKALRWLTDLVKNVKFITQLYPKNE